MPFQAAEFGEAWRARQSYQPFFCEENVWRLLQSPGALPDPAAAVFISNDDRTVAMWGQRAVTIDPIIWDYHVVALLPADDLIIDLDDRTAAAWPRHQWLKHAFRPVSERRHAPRFRIVPRRELLATFSSDRSHMIDLAGRPRHPLPPWPAPLQPAIGHVLPRFVDLADDIAGVVTDRAGLLTYRQA